MAAMMMVTTMMAIADANADAGNTDMHLRYGGSSESERRRTGDTENQISHFFSSLGLLFLERFAAMLVQKILLNWRSSGSGAPRQIGSQAGEEREARRLPWARRAQSDCVTGLE